MTQGCRSNQRATSSNFRTLTYRLTILNTRLRYSQKTLKSNAGLKDTDFQWEKINLHILSHMFTRENNQRPHSINDYDTIHTYSSFKAGSDNSHKHQLPTKCELNSTHIYLQQPVNACPSTPQNQTQKPQFNNHLSTNHIKPRQIIPKPPI